MTSKTLVVARREYLATVTRKGFLVATLGMPIFILAIFGFSGLVGYFAGKGANQAKKLAVIDQAGILNPDVRAMVQDSFGPDPAVAIAEKTAEALGSRSLGSPVSIPAGQTSHQFELATSVDEAAERDDLDGYYVIPADVAESGEVQLFIRTQGVLSGVRQPGWRFLQRWIKASMAHGELDESSARRLWRPLGLDTNRITEEGESAETDPIQEVAGFLVPFLFAMLFFIAVMTSSGYLLQGVAEEKENRVMEVLLSSVTPDQLLFGKVLGLCGAGLTQVAIWAILAIAPAAAFISFVELRLLQVVSLPFFFILGFLLFGTLMAAFGSLGNNLKESQQWAMVWSLAAASPFFGMSLMIQDPNGPLARIFSFIPLTAPLTMMLRTGLDQVPVWEVGLSLLVLAGSLVVAVRASAKLFRVGVLLYGKRPTPREVLRWLRAA